MNQDFLKTCPVRSELQDDDWQYIVFEFSMNYELDKFRQFYQDEKRKSKNKVDADKLRKLGYSEEQIQKRVR